MHRVCTNVNVGTLLDGDHLGIDLVDDVVDLLATRGENCAQQRDCLDEHRVSIRDDLIVGDDVREEEHFCMKECREKGEDGLAGRGKLERRRGFEISLD